MSAITKPQAVIFDWDDTLVDTWQTTFETRNIALKSMGVEPWSDEEARRRVGVSGRELFRGLFGERGREAEKIYAAAYDDITHGNTKIFNDVVKILQYLHDQKIYQAVVSSKRSKILKKEAEALGIEHYFSSLVGAGDAVADKPDRATVVMALEKGSIPPSENVFFIGDSHIDMICAKNAGCTAVLLETKLPPEELLSAHPPDIRVKTHKDLMEFIIQVCASSS